jgi:ADP-ribose pyrophosphatase YjhB (NUDIX family)
MVGVGVVVLKGDDVLLIKRGKPPRVGEWSLPGGLQELGETVREAACREVLEETNVEIALGDILDAIDVIRPAPDGRIKTHYTLVDFGAVWESGEPVGGDDAMHAEFVPLTRIEGLGMWSETVRIIKHAVAIRPPE